MARVLDATDGHPDPASSPAGSAAPEEDGADATEDSASGRHDDDSPDAGAGTTAGTGGPAGPAQVPAAVAPVSDAYDPGVRADRLRRGLVAVRPLLIAAAVGLVVLGIQLLAILAGDYHPFSGRVQYGLRAGSLVVGAVAVTAVWWARRRGQSWDADLIPALFGGLGALTLLVGLHGTPYDLYALDGDQLFRTAAVTRFGDSWWGGDYTYRGLPAYYAPTYFWVLGRAGDLAGVVPWHMLKYGTIAVTFLAPIVSYLLWRRIVTARVAALISVVPFLVPGLGETYAWIVLVAFVPWWLQVGHGLTRSGLRRWHPLVLGAIGAVLFTVYYYFFFIIPVALVLHLLWNRRQGRIAWGDLTRPLAVLGVSALGSSPYWAPLAWNFLTSAHFESLNNRWITLQSGRLALPMLEPSVIGVLCLIGLVFLVVTAREALSRALLVLLVSTYVWHAVGFLFLVVSKPLMSFRMRELVPVILLAAAAMALVRVAGYAHRHLTAAVVGRLAATGGVLLAVFAGDRFVDVVLADIHHAHNRTLPNGQLPGFHRPEAVAWKPAPARLSEIIDARYQGPGRPVVLTANSDLMALYPYYGFVQFNANYSHPTGRFKQRLAFLTELGRSASPAEFAARLRDNPYDRVDVIVLPVKDDKLLFRYRADEFPFGTNPQEISLPRNLVQPEQFDITMVDGTLVAVLRPPATGG
ncbi:arabinofuranosyltransferase [Plantactinospora sp. B24E8]|uniref:arabinofuranosyltransferase n=1 Tax=Plantactinospora sp. B24E8 TaxID=3153567 RepID=UPI00325EEBA7